MPKAKKNPNKTLDKILKLIDNDVKKIGNVALQAGPSVQLDSQTAQTLCRYATSLAGIKEGKEKEQAKEKKDLDKLSTEELIDMYKKSKT